VRGNFESYIFKALIYINSFLMKNQKKYLFFLPLIFSTLLFSGASDIDTGKKLSTNLKSLVTHSGADDKFLVWIFFSDKGNDTESLIKNPSLYLTERSIERRLKRMSGHSNGISDIKDIPVNKIYIDNLKSEEIEIKNISKWFNAVSCYVNKNDLNKISSKKFVREIDLVARLKKEEPVQEENSFQNFNPQNKLTSINYGASFGQSDIINVPLVHSKGFFGQGILIASFDSGFDNLSHPCFASMLQRGVRTYDFVNGDTIVADAPGRLGSGAHGTLTLSLVAGFAEGELVSPAFMSDYILAKTENTESETPIEEDNWIAAAEWADSLGADIITSSLGYLGFDPPHPSYDWTWMSGDSTRITKAANIAVEKGIIVVNSAGNGGSNPNRNTLSAPGDGLNVLTVGAVNPNKVRAGYSSVGPTYLTDRIKPDVMAQGTSNVCARPGEGSTGYLSSVSGTSLSAPMVAGVCALILNANPNLNPFEVMNFLRSNSSNFSNPNNLIGWGIVDANESVKDAEIINLPSDYTLLQNFPNPFNPSTTFRFSMRKEGNVTLLVYDMRGRLLNKLIDNEFRTPNVYDFHFNFEGNNSLPTGAYFYTLIIDGQKVDSRKMILLK
jgi:serine protease AprX